jgi:putative ABC transport system ATP-binding protein
MSFRQTTGYPRRHRLQEACIVSISQETNSEAGKISTTCTQQSSTTCGQQATNPSTTSVSPIATVHGLDFSFGEGALRKQVLVNVSLKLHEREIVILTGPSGSGKTTLLTLIGALRSAQPPAQRSTQPPAPRSAQGIETLNVLGHDLINATPQQRAHVRRQIGYIFQAHNLVRFLTAKQNVQMALELHPEINAAQCSALAIQALTAVGIAEHQDKYPEHLSGGQRQRVAIARALTAEPKLILADEPTAALDKQSGRDVVNLMRNLAVERGCTILMVTHDNRILDIADRIVHLEDGSIVPAI